MPHYCGEKFFGTTAIVRKKARTPEVPVARYVKAIQEYSSSKNMRRNVRIIVWMRT
jgi:hypothetical protein